MIAFTIYLKDLRTKTKTTHTEEQLQLAIEQLKKGKISLSKASEAYKIPEITLHKCVHNKVQLHGRGTATLLSTAFEFVLISLFISFANLGFSRKFTDGITIVEGCLVSTNQSNVSIKWYTKTRMVSRFHKTIES